MRLGVLDCAGQIPDNVKREDKCGEEEDGLGLGRISSSSGKAKRDVADTWYPSAKKMVRVLEEY